MRFAELSKLFCLSMASSWKGYKRSHGLESISWDIRWSSVRGGKKPPFPIATVKS